MTAFVITTAASLGLNAPSKVLTVHGVEGCTEAAQWRRGWGPGSSSLTSHFQPKILKHHPQISSKLWVCCRNTTTRGFAGSKKSLGL